MNAAVSQGPEQWQPPFWDSEYSRKETKLLSISYISGGKESDVCKKRNGKTNKQTNKTPCDEEPWKAVKEGQGREGRSVCRG